MSFAPDERELLKDLVGARPLIDVRAPIEFRAGTIPGAVNLPVLDDDERAAVGTTYKREGPDSAVALGHQLVSGDVLKERIAKWVRFARENPEAKIFCFRGGLRSKSVGEALRREGVEVPVIAGGYKRLRHLLLRAITDVCETNDFIVVSGFTGSGKTPFLSALSASRRVCDLEGLAHHRGSAFGKRQTEQPSQIDFENRLAVELLKQLQSANGGPILIEDESRMIGRVTLPAPVFRRINESPVYVLEKPRATRARELIEIYLADYEFMPGVSAVNRDSAKLEAFRLDVEANLQAISRRLGGAEYQELRRLFEEALGEQAASGNLEVHQDWVERLLERYYDPLYLRHLERIQDRVVARGSAEELTALVAGL